MNRIASDEPDEVAIIPKPIEFYYRGKYFQAEVSRTAIPTATLSKFYHGGILQLVGDFGRAWLTDPCSMILQESMHTRAMGRSEERKREAEIARRLKGG